MTSSLSSHKDSGLPRLQNIVVLRSFAMIAVVLYHCYCPWLNAWDWYTTDARPLYSIIFETMLVGRMPLFVAVSGYLFAHLYIDRGKYHNFKSFLNNKFQRLLVPCILFSALMSIVLQDSYIENLLGMGYHTWFLKMLFLCFMTAWMAGRYSKSATTDILLLCLAAAMVVLPDVPYLGIGQYFKYYIFFYLGFLMYKYREKLTFLHTKKSLAAMLILYCVLSLVAINRYLTHPDAAMSDIIHSDHTVAICRYLLRPLIIFIAFAIVDLFLRRRNAISAAFDTLNRYSYGIYLFHMLLLQTIYRYFLDRTLTFGREHEYAMPLILFAVVFTLSLSLTYLVSKWKYGKYLIG